MFVEFNPGTDQMCHACILAVCMHVCAISTQHLYQVHYIICIHHWLFHPETLLTPNSAVRDIVQGKEFAMPAALSPGPKFNMSQPIPKYSKIFQTQKRRHTTSYDVHTTSCESHCLIWIWLVGWSSIFWVPLKQNRSDRSGLSNIKNVWTKPANRFRWHRTEHIQAHNWGWSVLVGQAEITGRLDGDLRNIYLAHRLPFCHQQLVQGIKETCG